MDANACQIATVVEADVGPLCASCTRRGGCVRELAAKNLGERMDDGAYQLQLLHECEDYENDGTGKGRQGSLRPQMFEAGIRDLCCGCPSAKDGACRKRTELNELTRVSMKDGTYVHVAVIACKPQSKGLHQISEPRK
jgi:hypothetical protein